jgi:hypothetical protein
MPNAEIIQIDGNAQVPAKRHQIFYVHTLDFLVQQKNSSYLMYDVNANETGDFSEMKNMQIMAIHLFIISNEKFINSLYFKRLN